MTTARDLLTHRLHAAFQELERLSFEKWPSDQEVSEQRNAITAILEQELDPPDVNKPMKSIAERSSLANKTQTLLHMAVSCNEPGLIPLLFKRGASPNAVNEEKITALELAANLNRWGCVQAFLTVNAQEAKERPRNSFLVRDSLNWALWLGVSSYGSNEGPGFSIVIDLLEAKADPNCIFEEKHAFLLAVKTGSPELVTAFIEKGADPNLRREGTSPLLEAATNPFNTVVQVLLEKKANPEVQNQEGAKPITIAAFNQWWDTVTLLLQAYQHQPQADTLGKVLIYALYATQIEASAVVASCLTLRANPNVPGTVNNNNGVKVRCYPLHRAAETNDAKLANTLLDLEADPNVQNMLGRTPLHQVLATQTPSTAIIQRLIFAGANRDLPDNEGKIPYAMMDKDIGKFTHCLTAISAMDKQVQTDLTYALPQFPRSLIQVIRFYLFAPKEETATNKDKATQVALVVKTAK